MQYGLGALLASAILLPLFAHAQVPTPPTGEQLAALCAEAKNRAAQRGLPDGPNVTTGFGPTVTDTCIAAVINPAVYPPNLRSPTTYMCVGKRARVSINTAGLITTSYVPDRTVPMGRCETTACTNYNEQAASCVSAAQPTSIQSHFLRFLEQMQSAFLPNPNLDAIPVQIGIRG
jgi:hypothetical protein